MERAECGLYRSNYKNFEEYCRERFGFTRAAAYYLIGAADVMDNLLEKCQQFVDILPTKESQCRELASLDPELQPEAWLESVSRAGGRKVPPAKTIKSVVKEIKERDSTPPPIPYTEGDVVEIRVVLQKLLKDRAILTISSRYAATPKI